MLISAFALELAERRDLVDARTTYSLHEMGEETRHSRAFLRLVEQIGPTAPRLLMKRPARCSSASGSSAASCATPPLLYVFVLAGEEIPDLMQKLASEHPETDPLLAEVNRYHRQEEARHLAFARMRLPELRQEASALGALAHEAHGAARAPPAVRLDDRPRRLRHRGPARRCAPG